MYHSFTTKLIAIIGKEKRYYSVDQTLQKVRSLFTTQSWLLKTLKQALENTMGKGENSGNQHFLLFPQCFLLYLRKKKKKKKKKKFIL